MLLFTQLTAQQEAYLIRAYLEGGRSSQEFPQFDLETAQLMPTPSATPAAIRRPPATAAKISGSATMAAKIPGAAMATALAASGPTARTKFSINSPGMLFAFDKLNQNPKANAVTTHKGAPASQTNRSGKR
jgi:hypothetical protein